MAIRYAWVGGRKFYLWDKYTTWKEAYNTARYYRRKNKSRYFIMKKTYDGFLGKETFYELYLTRTMRLF